MSSTPPPPPLLGTPYLLSQSQPHHSQSTTTTTQITPSLCQSLSHFKKLLSSSRSLDDLITTRLNRANALSRNQGVQGGSECEKVWKELKERWEERNQVLTYCDQALTQQSQQGNEVANRFRREETGLSAEKGQLGRGRSTEIEIKIQQLHQEFSIERIIRRRTLDLLTSRCPHLPLSSTTTTTTSSNLGGGEVEAVKVPRALGEDTEEEERKRRRGRDERGGVRWA
ncbi:hypothetical protein JCM5350_005674 [Sporobolomyces pararoseus]